MSVVADDLRRLLSSANDISPDDSVDCGNGILSRLGLSLSRSKVATRTPDGSGSGKAASGCFDPRLVLVRIVITREFFLKPRSCHATWTYTEMASVMTTKTTTERGIHARVRRYHIGRAGKLQNAPCAVKAWFGLIKASPDNTAAAVNVIAKTQYLIPSRPSLAIPLMGGLKI